jgi:hypothetical protein
MTAQSGNNKNLTMIGGKLAEAGYVSNACVDAFTHAGMRIPLASGHSLAVCTSGHSTQRP